MTNFIFEDKKKSIVHLTILLLLPPHSLLKSFRRMKQFTLLGYLLLFITTQSIAADFVAPKLIDNLNPKGIHNTANMSRLEGWTLMSFIISKNGLPKHIEVVNSSNNEKYIKDSIRYLQNYRYSPATYKDEKVFSAKTLLMKHDKSFRGNNNDGISVGFSIRYERANKFILNKQFDEALDVLDELRDTNTKNLTEQALSAWLHSLYFYHKENWFAYRDNMLEANQLREHLPVKMAITNSQNLLQWQVFQNQYSDAVYTLASMANIKNAKMNASTHKEMLQPILDSIKSEDIVEINTTLSKGKSWLHVLPRSSISLTTVSGEIELAELRCDNHWHQFELIKIDKFNIPDNYLNCSILIKGKPGTQIKFVEQGALRQF